MENPSQNSENSPAAATAGASPLVHLAFDQDAACFVAATASGFRVFSCQPFEEVYHHDFGPGAGTGAPVAAAEMFDDETVAVVGGGGDPMLPAKGVRFWRPTQGVLQAGVSLHSAVRGVRVCRDAVAVVLDDHAVLFRIDGKGLRHRRQVDTGRNPLGLCAVSRDPEAPLVAAFPGEKAGEVRVQHMEPVPEGLDVHAHGSSISCLALSDDGRLLATASSKGTLLRIFSTTDRTMLQEACSMRDNSGGLHAMDHAFVYVNDFPPISILPIDFVLKIQTVRRGADRAEIHCLAFSPDSKWLAASSDKATVHVFSVRAVADSNSAPSSDREPTNPPKQEPATSSSPVPNNNTSSLSFMKGVLPRYFSSEWSLAQFRLREGPKYLVAFGQEENTVIITGMDRR